MRATLNHPTHRRPVGLSIRDLSVRASGVPLVHDVTFDVRPGEWLALLGPNGSGKTTLLRALAGVSRSSGQRVLSNDTRPDARALALMVQSPILPPGMSVAEYALLGRTPHLSLWRRESAADRALVSDVLQRLSLTPYADRPVDSLSGGEAQRASLARALVQQAPVLLLDEPTSALDAGAQTMVLNLVEQLRHSEGLTVVSALHDLAAAATYADRVLLLQRGRVRAHGTPGQVLTDDLLHDTYGAGVRLRYLEGHPVVLSAPHSRQPNSEGDALNHHLQLRTTPIGTASRWA